MNLLAHVVTPGSSAEVTGTLVRAQFGYVVAEDLVSEISVGSTSDEANDPTLVPLTTDATVTGTWSRLEGERVRTAGVWDGHRLLVSDVERAAAPALTHRVAEQRSLVSGSAASERPAAPPGHLWRVRQAERQLWDEGTVVASTEDLTDEGLHVTYVAHDVARVHEVMELLVGTRLAVSVSRYGKHVFAARDTWLQAVDGSGLLMYFGEVRRPHSYPRAFVGLRFVTAATAHELLDVPEELLTVHALLTPLGRRLPPRAEDL